MLSQKSCELYVAGLESNVDEQFLYNSFIQFGIIRSCKVMRHIVTHRSRGFGFITFQHPGSVSKAVEEMNGSVLFGKTIQVCAKEKYSQIDKNSLIYLLNLPDSFNDSSLNEMIQSFGKVFSKSFSSQAFESHEAPNRTVVSKKRASLQFENIKDALRFQKQYDTSEHDGQKIVVVFANMNKVLKLKGQAQENAKEKLEAKLQEFGTFKMQSFDIDMTSKSFQSSVVFDQPIQARQFYLNFKINKKAFPLFSVSEIFEKKKQIKKLVCSFFKKSDVKEETLKSLVQSNFQDMMKMEFEQDKATVEFGSDDSLSTFVMETENNKSQLSSMIDRSKGPIEYPPWVVKSLKFKRRNKMASPFMPQNMYGMYQPQQQMMQYNQQMMMQMMQYNPQMMMQFNYQQQQQAQYNRNMAMQMMQGINNPQGMQNTQSLQAQQQSDLAGLEIILNDTQSFKLKNKEEQNKIFMDIFVKKMEIIGDVRFKDQQFISHVAEYFLDDTVVDLEERLEMISQNNKIQEFLQTLDDM